MKKEVKFIIGLVAGFSVCLGSIVTATYAWFQSQRTATVTFTEATVYSADGNLVVNYQEITNGGVSSNTGSGTSKMKLGGDTENVKDVSGDGKSFYQPAWAPGQVGKYATSFSTVSNSATKNSYVSFGLSFQNTGTSAIAVYLSSNSKVEKAVDNAKSVLAAKATRVALYDQEATPNLLTMWQYDDTDSGSYKYLKPELGGTAYGGDSSVTTNYTLSDPSVDFASKWHVGDFTNVASAADGNHPGQQILTIAGHATSYVTVTIWIEGTLSSAKNDCLGGSVSVAFRFVALSA